MYCQKNAMKSNPKRETADLVTHDKASKIVDARNVHLIRQSSCDKQIHATAASKMNPHTTKNASMMSSLKAKQTNTNFAHRSHNYSPIIHNYDLSTKIKGMQSTLVNNSQ